MKHTNKTGKFAIAMTTLFLLVFVFPLSVFAKPEKVSVCHWDADNEQYKLIRISERALDAHLAQGGALPGTEGLDENCNPLADTDGDGIPDVDDSDDDLLRADLHLSGLHDQSVGPVGESLHPLGVPRLR